MSTPYNKYKQAMLSDSISESELIEIAEYIEELENLLENADILIEEYSIECGDNDLEEETDENDVNLDEEFIEDHSQPIAEAIVRRVKFNRAKRRTRKKYYKRNRVKIKMRQKRYKRTAAFRKANRKRSRTSYRHKKYI